MSMAMAHAVRKRARMAMGGECMACKGGYCKAHGGMMAEGGEVSRMNAVEGDEGLDMVDRIMRKRMSEGGMVANDDNLEDKAGFADAEFDVLPMEDDLESTYTGANSGDMDGAPMEDMDDHDDIVDRIMKKRRQMYPRTGAPGYPE